MKNWMYLICSLCLMACNNENTTPGPVSTVDSNLADPNDTVLPELYIDNSMGDTSFTIALDSVGNTILADDTNYQKRN